jgi:hypothetical protein
VGRERRKQSGCKAVSADLQQPPELFQRRKFKPAAVLQSSGALVLAAFSHVFRSEPELPGSVALVLSAIALLFSAEPQLWWWWQPAQ